MKTQILLRTLAIIGCLFCISANTSNTFSNLQKAILIGEQTQNILIFESTSTCENVIPFIAQQTISSLSKNTQVIMQLYVQVRLQRSI